MSLEMHRDCRVMGSSKFHTVQSTGPDRVLENRRNLTVSKREKVAIRMPFANWFAQLNQLARWISTDPKDKFSWVFRFFN